MVVYACADRCVVAVALVRDEASERVKALAGG